MQDLIHCKQPTSNYQQQGDGLANPLTVACLTLWVIDGKGHRGTGQVLNKQ